MPRRFIIFIHLECIISIAVGQTLSLCLVILFHALSRQAWQARHRFILSQFYSMGLVNWTAMMARYSSAESASFLPLLRHSSCLYISVLTRWRQSIWGSILGLVLWGNATTQLLMYTGCSVFMYHIWLTVMLLYVFSQLNWLRSAWSWDQSRTGQTEFARS